MPVWATNRYVGEFTGRASPSLSDGWAALDAVRAQTGLLRPVRSQQVAANGRRPGAEDFVTGLPDRAGISKRSFSAGRPSQAKEMFMCVKKINIITGLVAFTFWGCVLSPVVLGQQVNSPFTVADDIGLTLFAPQGGGAPELHFSPDNKYFAVWSERGRLDRNQVDDSLRFYRTQDIELFLKNPGLQLPEPAWIVAFSGKRYPVIWQWRWLADSSGVAFLSFDDAMASQQLILADLRRKKVEPLTSPTLEVRAFDIRDRQHYVYAVADHFAEQKKKQAERQAGAIVGTGVGIWELLFPDDPIIRWGAPYTKELWAVVDGKRFEVEHEGKPPVFDEQA